MSEQPPASRSMIVRAGQLLQNRQHTNACGRAEAWDTEMYTWMGMVVLVLLQQGLRC